jgi:hypothetical protein
MNFWKRLRFYGIGFGMGLLVLYATMGTRSCVSTSEMKMQELVFQDFKFSELALCKMRCLKMNELLLKIELRHFEVNYDLTSVHKKPCGDYFIQPSKGFEKEYPFRMIMQDCDSITVINDISINSEIPCNCQ